MQGDTIHTIHALKQREQKLKMASVRLETKRDQITSDLASSRLSLEHLDQKVEVLTKAGAGLRALMDKMVQTQVKSIESVITEGLKSIFTDQDLSFVAEIGQYRNKISVDLMVRRDREGVEIIGPPLETNGGGIASIAALSLRLLAILRLKKFPLLILDETLSAIGESYVDATGVFLRKLARHSNLPILLVTHNEAYLPHAETAYRGSEGRAKDGSLAMVLSKVSQ